jgi:6-phosphogluconolactonase
MNLIEYPDRDLLMLDLADRLASELADSLRRNERHAFGARRHDAGAGLRRAERAGARLGRTFVVLNDERWVPEDSPRSNTRLLRERLLVSKASAAKLIPLYAPAEARGASRGAGRGAPAASADLGPAAWHGRRHAHGEPFSRGRQPRRGARRRRAAADGDAGRGGGRAADHADRAGPEWGAISTHVLITGAEKREALERAAKLNPIDAPIALRLGNATVHWAE